MAIIAVLVLAAGAAIAVFALGGDDDGEITTATTDESDSTDPPPTTVATTTAVTDAEAEADEVTTTSAPAITEAPATTPSTEPPTSEAPATTPETTVATTVPDGGGAAPACTFAGVDTFDDIQVELSFTNPFATPGPIDVSYELIAGGTSFASSVEFVRYSLPAERFRIEVDSLQDLPEGAADGDISCEIVTIEEGFGFSDSASPIGTDTCAFVEIDSFDDIQVDINVTNPFVDADALWIHVALYGDGARFGNTSTTFNAVANGETRSEGVDTLTEFPEWADESSFTCAILAIERF